MLKKTRPLFLFPLIFTACTGLPSVTTASGTSFFSSAEVENGLVFIGAAGEVSDPDETLRLALEDAADRVAVFYKVSGEYAVEHNTGSGFLDYTGNTYTDLSYDKEGAARYIDALQFDVEKDTIEIENTFFVRAVYPHGLPVHVNYHPVYNGANQKPDWVDNPPIEIEGYETGVGFSNRRSSLADTYTNSRNNAVFAIIRNVNTTVRGSSLTYQDNNSFFGYYTSNDNITYSYGTLTGFYVLDTWLDLKTKTVWTLAIAEAIAGIHN